MVKVEAVARVLVQPARSTDTVDCTKDVTVLRSYRLAIACLCYEARIQVPYLPRCRAMRLVLWVRYARTRIVYVVYVHHALAFVTREEAMDSSTYLDCFTLF